MRTPNAAAVALLAGLLAGCDATPEVAAPTTSPTVSEAHSSAPTWALAARSPLSPRWGAQTAWVGDRLIVVGGFTALPCPGEIYCELSRAARDGAAYDPESNAWSPIARAPVPVTADFHAVVDDYLVVLSRGGVVAYDASHDRWLPIRELFPDFRLRQSWSLTAVGDRLYSTWDGGSFMLTESVQECDLSDGRCRQLPMSRVLASAVLHRTELGPAWIGRTGGAGLIADGPDRVDLWDGTAWQRSRVPSGVHAYAAFGTWVVARGDDERAHLAGAVDLRTGRWHPLQRRRSGRSWQPNGQGAGWHTYDGWLIDTELAATRVGRPPGRTARHDQSATFGDHQLFLFGGVDGRLSGPPRWRPRGPQTLTNELWIRTLPS